MALGFRSILGAGVLAAGFMVVPTGQGILPAFAAQDSFEQPVFGTKKRKAMAEQKVLGTANKGSKVFTETEILSGKNVSPMLNAGSAEALKAAATRYLNIISQGGFPAVPKGTYKKGAQNKGAAALNKRLFMEGYLRAEATQGEFADRVTSATAEALSRFQRNMGLAATGVVDGPTLAALNVPAGQRLKTIEANIARLDLYSQNLGDRYLVVNVPSQQIETVSNGVVFSRHNAIVGRPERPTPVVMTALSDINFNPYWNTPPSIIEKDLIPKMLSSTRILQDMNIRVFQGFGGPEIDPDSVDWGSAIADNYHFRQEPGPTNAMATAKVNFPSPFGIYLHDTPEQHLFKSNQRFYSSGCVRVEKIDVLLEWILNGQEGIGGSEIAALAETLERRDVKLGTPPQLRVTYLTAWPVGDTVAFRSDVYGLDGTGFTVGQPLPEGETSDDGQRFVLKPVPRKPSAVDAAEADGFGLFGSRIGRPLKPGEKPAKRRFNSFYSGGDFISPSEDASVSVPKKKLPFAVKQPDTATKKVVGTDTKKQDATAKKKATAKNGKDVPGLFDWAAYRKEQKNGTKKKAEPVVKSAKKKVDDKKVVAADAKKKVDDKKVVAADAKKKPAAPAKKIEAVDTKKVAAADPKAVKKAVAVDTKKPAADTKKAVTDTKKKPVEAAKKVADACKAPNAKDCKPAAKKP